MTEETMLDAKTALIRGEVEKSILLFTEVLAREPDNLQALFSRATAHLKKHAFDATITDCTAYLEIGNSNEKVFCLRGNAHMGKGNFDCGLKDFNRSIEINPHYPTAYFSRSELFKKMGEKEQAEADETVGNRLQKQLSRAFYESQGFMFQESN